MDGDSVPSSSRSLRRLEEVADKMEIREVLVRWNRALDRGDVELMSSTYHPDAIDEHGIHQYRSGREAALDYVERHVQGAKRHFHVTIQETIELDGDTAYCESYWIAILVVDRKEHLQQDNALNGGEVAVFGGGRYLDRFERRGDSWKIAHRRMIQEWRMHADNIPVDIQVPSSRIGFSFGPYQGARSAEDPSYALFGQKTTGNQ